MPKKFSHPKHYIYGAELVANINAAAAEKAEQEKFAIPFRDNVPPRTGPTTPDPSPAGAKSGSGEPDPQTSAATDKEH